ncbi:hypothetical protein QQP08_019718 [Theobroma cacao]|nr:hypothetical protein QQP08_019718 [Theobroma cacao]
MTELPSRIHRCKILCSAENHVGSVDVRGVLCILNSHLISLNRLQSMLAAHNLMVSKDTSVVLPIRKIPNNQISFIKELVIWFYHRFAKAQSVQLLSRLELKNNKNPPIIYGDSCPAHAHAKAVTDNDVSCSLLYVYCLVYGRRVCCKELAVEKSDKYPGVGQYAEYGRCKEWLLMKAMHFVAKKVGTTNILYIPHLAFPT